MSFIVRVLVLIAGHIATAIWNIFAASDSLALAGIIESLLGTARVLGSVSQSGDSFGCFGAGLKLNRGMKPVGHK